MAIASHDHRTSVHSESVLSRALRAADASVCLLDVLGRKEVEHLAETGAEFGELREILQERSYLADLIETYGTETGDALVDLLRIALSSGSTDPEG